MKIKRKVIMVLFLPGLAVVYSALGFLLPNIHLSKGYYIKIQANHCVVPERRIRDAYEDIHKKLFDIGFQTNTQEQISKQTAAWENGAEGQLGYEKIIGLTKTTVLIRPTMSSESFVVVEGKMSDVEFYRKPLMHVCGHRRIFENTVDIYVILIAEVLSRDGLRVQIIDSESPKKEIKVQGGRLIDK